MFKAEIIADSKNEFGNRITTFVVTFPRIILSEFNTHRALSKNSASSRAIPFLKMLRSVEENPFIPIKWMKDHSGMQGTEYLEGVEAHEAEKQWLLTRNVIIEGAQRLSRKNVSKQICNRLLEPFMWHTVIVTGTEWENFFALRAHEAAEIHMQKIANLMLEVYNDSEPKLLKAGEWHIPYGENINLIPYIKETYPGVMGIDPWVVTDLSIKVATARCAGVSFTIVGEDGKEESIAKLIHRYEHKLLKPGHMSPFEHCSMAPNDGIVPVDLESNFKGFIQHRKMIENENRKDNRVIKK